MLAACEKSNKAPDAITSIEVATRICGGLCQYNAILIKKNLSYQYFAGWTPGFEHTAKQNYFVAKVSQPFWDSLDHRLQRIDFSHLKLINDPVVVDDSFEIIIHYGSQVKRLKAACEKSNKAPDAITSIEVATRGCGELCQYNAILIKKNLSYQYFAGWTPAFSNQFKPGYYVSHVSQPFWDSITGVLRQIDLSHLKLKNDNVNGDDHLEIIIHYDSKVKHLTGSFSTLPSKLIDIFGLIDASYRTLNLKPAGQRLKFEIPTQQFERFNIGPPGMHDVYLLKPASVPDSIAKANFKKWMLRDDKEDTFIRYNYYAPNVFFRI
eukprot:gene11451-11541_t